MLLLFDFKEASMMQDTWRLLYSEDIFDCYQNMAIDKAIMDAVAKDEAPNTVRFYRWQPSAVSIGYFQSMKEVINIPACDDLGINYVRRITGGGAVYHDYEGELTYSIISKDKDEKLPKEIVAIYEKVCGAIIKGLSYLGINAEFKPINDITLVSNKKKISGSALTRKKGVILQHGTILRKVNVEQMFNVLIVPDEKFKAKMISSAKDRVSSLEIELGEAPSFEQLRKEMTKGFEEQLGISLVHQELGQNEQKEAGESAVNLFKQKEWLFKR
ncbi:lipoate--protein ligase family protein [Candidatus Heimdallarchaeota archaeon]|nr:MAG: lipoate--protein ligase family protein [Candidatus Heimdallarchaeota archaeon]